jgi:hypothetical protein
MRDPPLVLRRLFSSHLTAECAGHFQLKWEPAPDRRIAPWGRYCSEQITGFLGSASQTLHIAPRTGVTAVFRMRATHAVRMMPIRSHFPPRNPDALFVDVHKAEDFCLGLLNADCANPSATMRQACYKNGTGKPATFRQDGYLRGFLVQKHGVPPASFQTGSDCIKLP